MASAKNFVLGLLAAASVGLAYHQRTEWWPGVHAWLWPKPDEQPIIRCPDRHEVRVGGSIEFPLQVTPSRALIHLIGLPSEWQFDPVSQTIHGRALHPSSLKVGVTASIGTNHTSRTIEFTISPVEGASSESYSWSQDFSDPFVPDPEPPPPPQEFVVTPTPTPPIHSNPVPGPLINPSTHPPSNPLPGLPRTPASQPVIPPPVKPPAKLSTYDIIVSLRALNTDDRKRHEEFAPDLEDQLVSALRALLNGPASDPVLPNNPRLRLHLTRFNLHSDQKRSSDVGVDFYFTNVIQYAGTWEVTNPGKAAISGEVQGRCIGQRFKVVLEMNRSGKLPSASQILEGIRGQNIGWPVGQALQDIAQHIREELDRRSP